ncbi:hypothetical protein B0H66DRAFT_529562 [Apodospora peruviana]|uniref:NTF2 domain-containing protein n=1 Tax=Apodospora peruviana TaxID=516989 RepID=A0AAE0IHW9_9PEZI|nr:hypothetical protein B0H66DRAFT_529562 [Apodospora peruviana]
MSVSDLENRLNNVRLSAEAAETFVEWYYRCLNEGKPVAGAYTTNNRAYKAANHPPSDICINGLVVATPEEWDKMLEGQRSIKTIDPTSTHAHPTTISTVSHRGAVRYDVEAYDVHVINPDFRIGAPAELLAKPNQGPRLMMLLTVAGKVVFNGGAEQKKQHFSDVFTLVPNWDVIARHGSKATRRYLISSHTYRAY